MKRRNISNKEIQRTSGGSLLNKNNESDHSSSKYEEDRPLTYLKKTKTREVIIMKNNHQKSIIKLKQLKIEEQGSLENTDGTDYSSDSYELDIDVNQTYESDNDQERVKKKKCLSPIMKH